MKNLALLLLIVMCISCQNSSLYSGYVYDQNKEPLTEVKVQIVGSDIYSITDKNGFFSIDHKNRGDELLIIKEGYEMQFYTPNSTSEEIELVLIEESE